MGRSKFAFLAFLVPAVFLALTPSFASAKDNTQHIMGVGFQTHPNPLGGPDALLSFKIAASPNVEIATMGGAIITDEFFGLTLGGKVLHILMPEDHLNVYIAAAGFPTVGTLGIHRFDWFAGPGFAWYPEWAPHFEIFAELGLKGTVPLTDERAPGVVSERPLYFTTTGSIALGLHYWF